jgi:hypothetical protein
MVVIDAWYTTALSTRGRRCPAVAISGAAAISGRKPEKIAQRFLS